MDTREMSAIKWILDIAIKNVNSIDDAVDLKQALWESSLDFDNKSRRSDELDKRIIGMLESRHAR